jgi:DNA-directed RNA polymerase specialized sigma24 family protein
MDDKLFDPELLSEAWNQLHSSHRELIRKAHHLGWTTSEIAADLNVTESLVKSQFDRPDAAFAKNIQSQQLWPDPMN